MFVCAPVDVGCTYSAVLMSMCVGALALARGWCVYSCIAIWRIVYKCACPNKYL